MGRPCLVSAPAVLAFLAEHPGSTTVQTAAGLNLPEHPVRTRLLAMLAAGQVVRTRVTRVTGSVTNPWAPSRATSWAYSVSA